MVGLVGLGLSKLQHENIDLSKTLHYFEAVERDSRFF